MKKSEARKILREEAQYIKYAMLMGPWELKIYYNDLSDGIQATASILEEYQIVEVTIDSFKIDDREELLVVLRHELLHCLMPNLRQTAEWLRSHLSKDASELIDRMMNEAEERSIGRMEKMLDIGLGLNLNKVIAKARKELEMLRPPKKKSKPKKARKK